MIEEFRSIQKGLDELKAFAREMSARLDHVRSKDYAPEQDDLEGYDAYITESEFMDMLFTQHLGNESSFRLEIFNNLVNRMGVVNDMIRIQTAMAVEGGFGEEAKAGLVQDHLAFGDLFNRSNQLYRQYADDWRKSASASDDPSYLASVDKFRNALAHYSEHDLVPAFSSAATDIEASLVELTRLRLDYAESCYTHSLVSLSFASYSTDRSRYMLKAADDGIFEGSTHEIAQYAVTELDIARELVDQSFKNIRNIEKFLARVYDADPDAELGEDFEPTRLEHVPLNLNI